MTAHVQVYTDSAGEWRWRYVAANHKVMADSAEGYTRRADLFIALEEVFGTYLVSVPTVAPTDDAYESSPGAWVMGPSRTHLPVVLVDAGGND